MRHNSPIMKEFISSRFPNLAPNADIEKEAFDTRVCEFSEKHDLSIEFVRSILNEYFADKQSITKITLHEKLLDKKLPLIKQTTTINGILTFIGDMYNKFMQYT